MKPLPSQHRPSAKPMLESVNYFRVQDFGNHTSLGVGITTNGQDVVDFIDREGRITRSTYNDAGSAMADYTCRRLQGLADEADESGWEL